MAGEEVYTPPMTKEELLSLITEELTEKGWEPFVLLFTKFITEKPDGFWEKLYEREREPAIQEHLYKLLHEYVEELKTLCRNW